MGNGKMLFQGYERIGNQDDPNALTVKQEWAVQITVGPPV